MAQFALPPGVCLLALLLSGTARLTWAGAPIIRQINQEGPLLEGNSVVLECLSEEDGEDLSTLTFQKYNEWLHSWITLDEVTLLCRLYGFTVSHEGGRLLLTISEVQRRHTGPYRCYSSNATSNASFSNELDLKMEYLHSVFLRQVNTWCGTVGNSISLHEGSNLELQCWADSSQPPLYEWSREGEDWIVASDTLTLNKLTQEHTGNYVCKARHPTLPQLSKSKSIRLVVEGRGFTLDALRSVSTPMLGLIVGLPAMLLLLLIVGFAFLIPRLRAKKKAAQEDAGQRTPIYKGSLDSVPSVVADTHPLVM